MTQKSDVGVLDDMAPSSTRPASRASSTDENSTASSRSASSPPSSVQSDEDLNQNHALTQTNDLPSRSDHYALVCPFQALDCSISFGSKDFEDWTICIFYDATFQGDDPWRNWREHMHHVAGHFDDGSAIEHAMPDFALLHYLQANKLMPDEQYERAIQLNERVHIDSLRPHNFITEESKQKMRLVEEAERITERPGKYKGKSRATLRRPYKVVIHQDNVPSRYRPNPEVECVPLLQEAHGVYEPNGLPTNPSPLIVDPDIFSDDEVSDVSSLEEYQREIPSLRRSLPPGLDLDEDLIDPKRHNRMLRDIQDKAFQNSIALPLEYELRTVSEYWESEDESLCERHRECREMLRLICSNIRMLQEVGFCQGRLSLLKVDPQRTNVALLVGISVDDILRLGESFEEKSPSMPHVPKSPTPRSTKSRAHQSRRCDGTDKNSAGHVSREGIDAVWRPPKRLDGPVTETSRSLMKYAPAIVPKICKSQLGSGLEHILLRVPEQAEFSNPFLNPVIVPVNSQDMLENWPVHGSLVTIRNSVTVINHGRRWEDLKEPRIEKHVNNSRLSPPSTLMNPQISHTSSHCRPRSRSNRVLGQEVFWRTLAEECKALFKSAQLSLQDQGNEASIYTMLRTLDLIILAYAGAHVADLDDSKARFGQKRQFFKVTGRNIYQNRRPCPPQIGAITLARRTLRCLDSFFSGQTVWVFHEDIVDPRSSARLLLSATPEDFADIWGPMWKIKDHETPSRVLRYDLENGTIVLSDLSRDFDEIAVIPEANEDLCHWLSDIDFRRNESYPSTSNTAPISKQRLLIGARKRVRLKVNKEQCDCTAARITKKLRNASLLRPSGTSRDRKRIDAEAVNFGMTGGITPLQAGYAMTIKTIVGRTDKESLMKRWTLEKHKRNAYVLLEYKGVEMSFCNENSRRIRLIDLLATTTMSRLIADIDPIRDPACKSAVDSALQSEPEKVAQLYHNHPEWRDEIGSLVSSCLDFLADTGTTQAMGEPLSVFWMHDHVEYLLRYPPRTYRWSGFILDTDHTSSFVVFEEKCLIFKFGRGCQHPPPPPKDTDKSPPHEDAAAVAAEENPVFETAIMINDLLSLPPGLKLVKPRTPDEPPTERPQGEEGPSQTRSPPPRWKVRDVAHGSTLPMGDRGTLVVIEPLPNSALLTRLIPNNPIREAVRGLFARVADRPAAEQHLAHFEAVADPLAGDYPPLGVFITA